MDDFLSKPVSLPQLEAMIRKWNPNFLPHSTADQMTPEAGNQSLNSTAHSVSSTATPALEMQTLQNLAELRGKEDGEFLIQVIDQFLDDLSRYAEAMESAWGQQNLDRLMKTAHTCKGSCRMIGATALAEASYALESIGRKSLFPTSSDPLKRWETEKERTRQSLLEFRNQRTAPLKLPSTKPSGSDFS